MAKYRKKPVVIEAVQWWPCMGSRFGVEHQEKDDAFGIIRTLEGAMEVSPGDWVITGVKGEKYACKDEIFQMTYDPAEENK